MKRKIERDSIANGRKETCKNFLFIENCIGYPSVSVVRKVLSSVCVYIRGRIKMKRVIVLGIVSLICSTMSGRVYLIGWGLYLYVAKDLHLDSNVHYLGATTTTLEQ